MAGVISFRADRKNSQVFRLIGNIDNNTRRAIRQTWFKLGKDLKVEANKEILRKPKSGRLYIIRTRSGRRRRHVASAPGETHANLTGRARRSLSWKVHGTDRMDFGYGVSTTAANQAPVYAEFLEFGSVRMAPRPSLQNAIAAVKSHTEVHFNEEMLKTFKPT